MSELMLIFWGYRLVKMRCLLPKNLESRESSLAVLDGCRRKLQFRKCEYAHVYYPGWAWLYCSTKQPPYLSGSKDCFLLTPHVHFGLAAHLHLAVHFGCASHLHSGTQAERLSFPLWTLLGVVAEAWTGSSSWKWHLSLHTFCQQEQVVWACLSSTG